MYKQAQAIEYAASRPNYLGGNGLIYLNKSRVYSNMVTEAKFLGDFSEAAPLFEAAYAAVESIPSVKAQARNGTCAAAFPVF